MRLTDNKQHQNRKRRGSIPVPKDPPGRRGTATYTVQELSDVLGVSTASVYAGLRSGKIPALRLGKRFVIARSAITEWLATAGAAFPGSSPRPGGRDLRPSA